MAGMMTIRKMKHTDFAALYKLVSDPEVMEFLEPPFTKEKTARFLDAAGLSDPPRIYAAEDEKGRFIGYVIYHDYDEDTKEIGWVLNKNVWGKGCAKALTEQLIEKAVSEGKGVILECVPGQAVTRHIAEAFGFAYTGRADGCDVYRL